MNNITQTLQGNILTLTIDLSKTGKLSGSGKSLLIASTGGSVKVDGRPDVTIGVNVYTPAK